MTRSDLTDQEWERLESKLPSSKGKRGGQYKDHRRILNGILWVLRTGAPWRDLPERYGKWKTCHDRLLRWRRKGIWEQVLQALQGAAEAVGEVVWTVVSIDGTTVRAHQHAAGARHTPAQAEPPAAAEKGGSHTGRRGAGSQSRRVHHQAASRRRRARAAADGPPDGRPAARKYPVGAGARWHSRSPAARSAPEAAGPSGTGQRLQLSEVSEGTPLPRHPARDPRAERPASAAAGERLPGRPATPV
jgi:transposase